MGAMIPAWRYCQVLTKGVDWREDVDCALRMPFGFVVHVQSQRVGVWYKSRQCRPPDGMEQLLISSCSHHYPLEIPLHTPSRHRDNSTP